jgi:superfamily I DNA/RNA helicase
MLPKHLFENSPETLTKRQAQFEHILVDEAQDTNTIQFELMRKLCDEKSVITFI